MSSSVQPAIRTAVVLFVGILLATIADHAPAPVAATAPSSEFSSGRALLHLQRIAERPHPVGGAWHESVRSYVESAFRALGIEPHIQDATDLRLLSGMFMATHVKNVVARLPGTANSRALMIACHYDSAPSGPGASDDGHAVAAMLEVARALRSSPPLKNDVLFLVTDGEEVELNGAHAFVEQSGWPAEVGAVLNFEARGAGGPAMMFETSPMNGWLIRRFAKAAPHPSATSLSYEIYRRMPNDTDLTVFKEAGLPGLNFAYIGKPFFYHTSRDSVANMEEGSLQQQGDYMLSLARELGSADLRAVRERNRVYFSLPGGWFVHYNERWSVPLAIFCVLALAVALWRGALRWKAVLMGALGYLAAIALISFAAGLMWSLIERFSAEYAPFYGGLVYNLAWHEGAFLALAILGFLTLVFLFLRKQRGRELAAGALVVWAAVMLAATLTAPGASYLVQWPFLFALAAFSIGEGFGMDVLALPVVFLFVPVIRSFFTAMGASMASIEVVLILLCAGLLVVHAAQLLRGFGRGCFAVATLALVVCLAGGYATRGYTPAHPKPNSVFFVEDADAGNARWLSGDAALDPWTRQFFGGATQRTRVGLPFWGATHDVQMWSAAAHVEPLAPPEATITERGSNFVRLRLRSPRGATGFSLWQPLGTLVDWVEVNGRRAIAAGPAGRLFVVVAGVETGEADVAIQFKQMPERILLTDMSYGLPVPVTPRADWMMAGLVGYQRNETTIVSKSVELR
jgi:Peptidase family M28